MFKQRPSSSAVDYRDHGRATRPQPPRGVSQATGRSASQFRISSSRYPSRRSVNQIARGASPALRARRSADGDKPRTIAASRSDTTNGVKAVDFFSISGLHGWCPDDLRPPLGGGSDYISGRLVATRRRSTGPSRHSFEPARAVARAGVRDCRHPRPRPGLRLKRGSRTFQ